MWLDDQPTFEPDTPLITMKNLEVLIRFMEQPSMKYEQKRMRGLILSEQGFHACLFGSGAGDTVSSPALHLAQDGVAQSGGGIPPPSMGRSSPGRRFDAWVEVPAREKSSLWPKKNCLGRFQIWKHLNKQRTNLQLLTSSVSDLREIHSVDKVR